jgi:hypothetical protein
MFPQPGAASFPRSVLLHIVGERRRLSVTQNRNCCGQSGRPSDAALVRQGVPDCRSFLLHHSTCAADVWGEQRET